ncbi:pyrroline-5-carboxylate reductase family protein [Burkholderia oklahomensis]|uniref:NADP oxidoreductase coenzyme F420-dependent family protein n=1 Tax=Burkholderia oklahomensis TaxID=342113 RepID=A0AAI8B3V2_9BURK|nr:NAD(P)-binding domain-containing protein [Burkholderia oklahomensis]AIO65216.1 NADP oxidoreductase coenzyme F420-dependent family protein [Burkholderia oklahomensis]AOI41649.1 hypothetical protein WG70_18370 [Burkholderia oklahomensis EO147]KUY69247.1 hypothetical protein WG70_23500 [Burkholderia oklahomensis EO147]QPS36388.1 NAD(P)-binding domain-containing protein [Burkholderia oklahomensis]
MTDAGKCDALGRIGIVGAGHVGVAVAARLVASGVGGDSLRLGNRESASSRERAAAAGVADLLTDVKAAVDNSDVIVYAVRPADCALLGAYLLERGQSVISVLAGTPLANVARHARGAGRLARAMISSPDTIVAGRSIGAFYGDAGAQAKALFERIGTEVVALDGDARFDAFTALGPCLPIALTYCEAAGIAPRDDDVLECAAACGLGDWRRVLDWAQQVRPRNLSEADTQAYLDRAATPGGITEAILRSLRTRGHLSDALRDGIRHGAAMARS